MQKQEPTPKPRRLIQAWLEPEDVERAERLPQFHRGLIAHMARTGYLKELKQAELEANKNQNEQLAS